jgi:hypothetical protein
MIPAPGIGTQRRGGVVDHRGQEVSWTDRDGYAHFGILVQETFDHILVYENDEGNHSYWCMYRRDAEFL